MKIVKFRRITSLAVAGIMICQMGVATVAANKTQRWADEYINELTQKDELKHYFETSHILNNLDKPISKGDFIKLLTGLLDMENVNMGEIPNDDIFKTDLNNSITRENAITIAGMLCRLETHKEIGFVDKDSISQDAYGYISAFVEQGIIAGYRDKKFHPKNQLTGIEAIVIVSKLIKQNLISSNNVADLAGNITGFRDGEALQANFFRPVGLCDAGKGGIIVVDSYNNLVREISNQKVETIAGRLNSLDNFNIPIGGYMNSEIGDALFNKPQFCTINTAGDILVSDTENNTLRLISNSKVTSLNNNTLAGHKDGNLEASLFNKPSDVVYDRLGNIYVADTLNNCIRYIDIKNSKVSTFSGKQLTPGLKDGSIDDAQFNQPVGLAIDKDGVLYISDSGNQRIRKISKGIVSTLAGSGDSLLEETSYIEGGYQDGNKEQAKFNFPSGIDVNEDGIVFVADTGNHRIRAITKTKVITIAGNGEAAYMSGMPRAASFNQPSDVLVKDSKIFISDTFNSKIRVLNIDTNWLRD